MLPVTKSPAFHPYIGKELPFSPTNRSISPIVQHPNLWEQTVSRHLPHLSKPQAVVLTLWSYAMIVSRS